MATGRQRINSSDGTPPFDLHDDTLNRNLGKLYHGRLDKFLRGVGVVNGDLEATRGAYRMVCITNPPSEEVKEVIVAIVKEIIFHLPSLEQRYTKELSELFFRRLFYLSPTVFPRSAIGAVNSELERMLTPELASCRDAVAYWEDKLARVKRGKDAARYRAQIGAWKFRQVVAEARLAIRLGIHPERIVKGSSGSYFVKDRFGVIIGVFKPRSEEPYAPQNPKWPKKVQKVCCPCMFGRACLLSNQGYLSEAGASLVDRRLGLQIVPRTEVIQLASPVFNNILKQVKIDRHGIHMGRTVIADKEFPIKTGSFQIFLHGYMDGNVATQRFATNNYPDYVYDQFVDGFQRMIIVDYLIRNTDRGKDNWLVHIDDRDTSPGGIQVTLAAIDSGLAFPIKHPDGFRKFPFIWRTLPVAQHKFYPSLEKYADKLTDESFMHTLMAELYLLFVQDPNFNEQLYCQQMTLMRGQGVNLARALRSGLSPAELAAMPHAPVHEVTMDELQPTISAVRHRISNEEKGDMEFLHELQPTNVNVPRSAIPSSPVSRGKKTRKDTTTDTGHGDEDDSDGDSDASGDSSDDSGSGDSDSDDESPVSSTVSSTVTTTTHSSVSPPDNRI